MAVAVPGSPGIARSTCLDPAAWQTYLYVRCCQLARRTSAQLTLRRDAVHGPVSLCCECIAPQLIHHTSCQPQAAAALAQLLRRASTPRPATRSSSCSPIRSSCHTTQARMLRVRLRSDVRQNCSVATKPGACLAVWSLQCRPKAVLSARAVRWPVAGLGRRAARPCCVFACGGVGT
jgi:hypothetical protein